MSVRLVDVSHSFGRPLFAPVSFAFRAGRITGVVGPSGCGKSTLLGIVAGMIRPSSGRVERNGERCAWVFQNPHGVARRSALDHVSTPLLARGMTRRSADEKALAFMETFGLKGRSGAAFATLSGGEAQRLMLARAMASRPDLLLVDEPTAQLDRDTAAQVNNVIGRLADGGAAVVIATHDAETQRACDTILDLSAPTRV